MGVKVKCYGIVHFIIIIFHFIIYPTDRNSVLKEAAVR